MKKGILVIIVAAAVTAVLVLFGSDRDAGRPAEGPGARESEPPPAATDENLSDVPQPPIEARETLPATPDEPPASEADGTAAAPATDPTLGARFSVRVLDLEGRPMRDVALGRSPDAPPLGTSNAYGIALLDMAANESSITVYVVGRGYATVRACHVKRETLGAQHIVVAAPSLWLEGRVTDSDGVALDGVLLSIDLRDELLSSFPLALDRDRKPSIETRTNDAGAFRLKEVPLVAGARIRASRGGYEEAFVDVPETSRNDVFFVLERTEEQDDAIVGRVLLPSGEPADGARVTYGWAKATCDADGRFALREASAVERGIPLVAGLADVGLAVIDDFGAVVEAAAPYPPEPVELRLAPTFSIAGTVVDAQGRGLEGWNVGIREGLATTTGVIPPDWGEELAGHRNVTTDASGAFVLTGLLDREYVVWAYSRDTLAVVESEPTRASTNGAPIELVASDEGILARIAGRVLDRRGAPIEGVRVSVSRVTYRAQFGQSSVGGQGVLTDEGGRFELEHVPHDLLVGVSGDAIMPMTTPLEDAGDPEALELSVARRRHFRVVVAASDVGGLTMQLLDAEDTPLALFAFQSNGWGSTSSRDLGDDGRSAVYAVSEDAVTLVLRRAGIEVHRGPIVFDESEVAELRVAL